ncbi:MAG: hypothetical protein AAGI34_02960 [Pseudomonadota bacterium]
MRAMVAALVASTMPLALSGCESFRLFNDYRAVESESVAEVPWPLLVEVPSAPPLGQFSEAVPDPARGIATEAELGLLGAEAAPRREAQGVPVLDETERAALQGQGETARARAESPLPSASSQPRPEPAQSEPILSESERSDLLSRAEAARERARQPE